MLLPAKETRSAHNFCDAFTAAESQSSSGSGLSFYMQAKDYKEQQKKVTDTDHSQHYLKG